MASPSLKVAALNCSLKSGRSSEPSSTEKLLAQVLDAFAHDAHSDGETVRVVDHDIKPGVTSNEGAGDDRPYPGV